MKYITLLATAAALGAAPSSTYNVAGQRRTRTAAAMKQTKTPLRFTDGTATGFFANGDDPSLDGNGGNPAPIGSTELDAQEILSTASGQKTYFRPGGGPNLYAKDYVLNGQYGHIFSTDLTTPPTARPQNINGNPAPLGHGAYYITPTRIPQGMWYKANVVNGSSGSNFYTYGNPGYDKTGGRGDWTYITWSFVQNGGATYPANVNGGGGLVRALGKRNQIFRPADVAPIIGYSYGADNAVNGRVTAFYGKTSAGPGDNKGSAIFGWLIYSYQQNGKALVPCVKRVPATPTPPVPHGVGNPHDPHHDDLHHGHTNRAAADSDAMNRMALNVMDELEPNSSEAVELRKDFDQRFAKAGDAVGRMDLLTELAQIDEASTISTMRKILGTESDETVREQAINLMGFLRRTGEDPAATFAAFSEHYQHSHDTGERVRMLEVAASIPDAAAVEFGKRARAAAAVGSEERFAANGAILLLSTQMTVNPALMNDVTNELKQLAKGSSDANDRLRAATLLAGPGQQNHAFLESLLANETNLRVREFLTLAADPQPTR